MKTTKRFKLQDHPSNGYFPQGGVDPASKLINIYHIIAISGSKRKEK